MKKYLTLVILLCINFIQAQVKKEYYDTGELKIEGKFIEGKKKGLWKYFYKNGIIAKTINYKDNKVKEWKKFYDDGNIKEEGNSLNDKKIGLWKNYYHNGIISRTINYKDNNKQIWKENYSSGKLRWKAECIDGIRNGLYKGYFESGELSSIGVLKNNLPVGKWKEYYKSGQLAEVRKYKDDIYEIKSYYPNGILHFIGKRTYDTGTKIGEWIYYKENGEIDEKIKY